MESIFFSVDIVRFMFCYNVSFLGYFALVTFFLQQLCVMKGRLLYYLHPDHNHLTEVKVTKGFNPHEISRIGITDT